MNRLARRHAFPVALFCGLAPLIFGWIAYSSVTQSHSGLNEVPPTTPHPWLAGWMRWDAGWYAAIADVGYSYTGPGRQSPVAFFPGYPLLLRFVSEPFGNTQLVGIVLTFVLGLAATVVFHHWAARRLGARAARFAVGALLLYPFSWFLFGAVYSDALFLLAAVTAFLLLDLDRPVAAGLVGAIATASRPVGPALVVAMCLFVLARTTEGDREDRRRLRLPQLSRLRPNDAGVLLSVLGIAGYVLFLQRAFGEPLAFIKVQSAPGWNHTSDTDTVFKITAWRILTSGSFGLDWYRAFAQGLVTILFVASIPVILRRLGVAFAAYVALLIIVPVASTADFTPMGRYLLAAFPGFAAAGAVVEKRRWLLLAVPGSVGLLLYFSSHFAREFLIT